MRVRGGESGKTRTRHNANGEGSRIASRLGSCNLTAILRARNIDLRQGERASDVKGGEDDWEGEGELHFFESMLDKCGAFTPLRRVIFILSSLVNVWQSYPLNAILG